MKEGALVAREGDERSLARIAQRAMRQRLLDRCRRQRRSVRREGLNEGRRPHVARQEQAAIGILRDHPSVRGALGMHLLHRSIRHRGDLTHVRRQVCQRRGDEPVAEEIHARLARVARPDLPRVGAVVGSQRTVGVIGNASFERLQVGDSQERVTAADVPQDRSVHAGGSCALVATALRAVRCGRRAGSGGVRLRCGRCAQSPEPTRCQRSDDHRAERGATPDCYRRSAERCRLCHRCV